LKNGYDTVLYFLGTGNIEININRVKARVLEGGHDVAIPIIEQRHLTGMSYLKARVLEFKIASLIDVSTHEPRLMAKLIEGQIVFKEPTCPQWVQAGLELAERIQHRLKRD
jgi:predicted ABC-type ATPase